METEEGNRSDHLVAYFTASFEASPQKKVTYSYRAFTPEGADKFFEMLARLTWEDVFSAKGSDAKAKAYQSKMDALMDKCFQWRTTTRSKDKEPWVDDFIKTLWKRRCKVYDRDGRSLLWRTLSRKASKRYSKRMAKFLELQKRNLTSGDASRKFFKQVWTYSSREKPPDFDVRDLFPGKPDLEVAENLADHFNSISSEFDGLNPGGPPVGDDNVPLPVLSVAQVATRMKLFKKPRGIVDGDIFPTLVTKHHNKLAVPLADIYNELSSTGNRPTSCKAKFVTPIPKTPLPQSANNLRNISCTMLTYKVYESFMLNWLSGQTGLRGNQYGGVKGSGSEPLLVRMW